jgi:hypothetical protein
VVGFSLFDLSLFFSLLTQSDERMNLVDGMRDLISKVIDTLEKKLMLEALQRNP